MAYHYFRLSSKSQKTREIKWLTFSQIRKGQCNFACIQQQWNWTNVSTILTIGCTPIRDRDEMQVFDGCHTESLADRHMAGPIFLILAENQLEALPTLFKFILSVAGNHNGKMQIHLEWNGSKQETHDVPAIFVRCLWMKIQTQKQRHAKWSADHVQKGESLRQSL